MNIKHSCGLNLSADSIPPRLHMVQGDANSRTIVATLWDGSQPYSIPAEAIIMVRFRKPDGTGGLYDTTESGSQVTVSGNTVAAPVATQMLTVAGVVQAQVDIYGTATGKAAEKLATFRFAVEVAPSVYPDAEIISNDYFNIIAADIGKAVEAAARAEAAQAAASAAQQGAESARAAAVNAKTAAESAKTAAVAAQNKSEAAQTAAGQSAAAAQTARKGAETARSGAQAAQAAAESAKAAAQAAQSGAKSARAGAETAKGAAEDSAEDAEAWAVGQRNGVDVPSTDPTYHNNAKYYKDQAQTIADGEFVSYGAPQSLTDAQKQQARGNINAPAPYTAGENISISGSVIATKAFPCNPNILDNGNFQVWQRYPEGTYTGVPDMTYIADRWMFKSSDGSVTNTITKAGDYGIKNASGPNMRVYQRLENAAQYNGKLLTLSVLKGDGSLTYNTRVASGWTETTDIFAVFAPDVAWLYTGDTWLAAKLELGSQQTLAHQEDGVWVLNEIPNYGEQLRRCQRYLRPAGYNFIVSKNSAGNWYGSNTFGNSEPMRAVPVIINGNYKAQPIRDVTGGQCATITNVFSPTIYGQFAVQLSPLGSIIPNFVYIDSTGFNPLLSADL